MKGQRVTCCLVPAHTAQPVTRMCYLIRRRQKGETWCDIKPINHHIGQLQGNSQMITVWGHLPCRTAQRLRSEAAAVTVKIGICGIDNREIEGVWTDPRVCHGGRPYLERGAHPRTSGRDQTGKISQVLYNPLQTLDHSTLFLSSLGQKLYGMPTTGNYTTSRIQYCRGFVIKECLGLIPFSWPLTRWRV